MYNLSAKKNDRQSWFFEGLFCTFDYSPKRKSNAEEQLPGIGDAMTNKSKKDQTIFSPGLFYFSVNHVFFLLRRQVGFFWNRLF